MAFNKPVTSQNPNPQADKGPVGVSSPKPQQSGSFSPKGQNMPKSNGNISPKQQIYKDSTGTTWKQNPKQRDGIFKSKSFSPTNAPFVSSEKPAGPGATPEQGWKQKSNLELKQKPNSLVNSNRQKIVNQGFSPATKPAQKYKWSEGLSDDDNSRVNKALNSIAAWGGDKDLSKVNKDWASDLYYQLKTDGASEEDALRLANHFDSSAPSYEEVFPKQREFNIFKDGEPLGTVKASSEEEAMRNASGSLFFGAGDEITAEEKVPSNVQNPIRNGSIPGFDESADAFDKMMGSAQKIIDNKNDEIAQRKQASKLFGTKL